MLDSILKDKAVMSAVSYEVLKRFWQEHSEKHNLTASRARGNVVHRHAFMHIARTNLSLTTSMIGGLLNKDHATVIYACRQHLANYKYDSLYRTVWDELNEDTEDMLLANGIVPEPMSFGDNSPVGDIHFRYLNISRRLRGVITEFEEYKVKVAREIRDSKKRIAYVKQVEQQNYRLNEEILRLRNLL